MASLGLAWETSQPTAPAPLDGRHADRDTLPFQPRFIHRPDLRRLVFVHTRVRPPRMADVTKPAAQRQLAGGLFASGDRLEALAGRDLRDDHADKSLGAFEMAVHGRTARRSQCLSGAAFGSSTP